METVVFKDSPLADYFEGEGEAPSEWPASTDDVHDTMSDSSPSFAPRGLSTLNSKVRRRIRRSLCLSLPQADVLTKTHRALSRSVHSTLGSTENSRFLEQFRYTVVASQLLDAHVNASRYNPVDSVRRRRTFPLADPTKTGRHFTITGVIVSGVGAFVFVCMVNWARGGTGPYGRWSRILSTFVLLIVFGVIAYQYLRHQSLEDLRRQAIDAAAQFVTESQSFDASAIAALNIIQDVELVSRGYKLSTPLPPITRIEERSQSRRCSKLRRSLNISLGSAISVVIRAYDEVRPLAEETDLERYLEIYDLDLTEVHIAEVGTESTNVEDEEAIKSLRAILLRFYNIRKILLCSLLALPADGSSLDFGRWRMVTALLLNATEKTGQAAEMLRTILLEEERFPMPMTPKQPSTPGKERVRMQLRKLGSLSQGIRSLQAKMHVLREESEQSLEETSDVTELGSHLMTQYESIGNDLQMLVQEWECGRASLAFQIDKNERRISQLSAGRRSPTSSLDGTTAVDGSPTDALSALNGGDTSRSSMDFGNSENEEIFEAVALPAPRSTLTREERIAKMKEDRAKASSTRERMQANTHMLRELESVIKIRPRRQTTGTRITSI